MAESAKHDLMRRALAAHYRFNYSDVPFRSDQTLPLVTYDADQIREIEVDATVELDGRHYVTISENGVIIEVYRVRNNGILRRMRRWPKGLS